MTKFKDNLKLFSKPAVFLVVIIGLLFFKPFFYSETKNVSKSFSDEIVKIKESKNIREQVDWYKKLITRVGPEEAQEELYKSGLPFTGETHLVNHEVGDYLYEKYGYSGIKYCRDYFLSSCYHGFILNAIADGGLDEVAEVFRECLPSGPAIYTQCAHGIGHGVLVDAGYMNLVTALKTCDKVGDKIPEFPLFNCYDGVFMENIWAVHEGKSSPDRWVKEEDIWYPCNDRRIDKKYIRACWSNQPSLVYQLFNGDIKKVATELCNKVPETDNKRTCFDGLARQIHPIAAGNSEKTLQLCKLMPNVEWVDFCLVTNAVSSYSVGDRFTPFKICPLSQSQNIEKCFLAVFNMMRIYSKDKVELKKECGTISEGKWQYLCQKTIQ